VPVLTGGAADTGNTSAAGVRAGVRQPRAWRRALVLIRPVVWVAAIAAGGTILYLLPRTTGTTWDEIGRTLERVSFSDVVVLSGLWALALFCYSFVLTGSLPGLRRRRAMTLNLTGSAVANVAPLGGAWGVGLNALMLRRWGYAGKDIASFMMISNIWNVLAKLAVSAVVIGLLAVGGVSVPLSAHGARAVVKTERRLLQEPEDQAIAPIGRPADVTVRRCHAGTRAIGKGSRSLYFSRTASRCPRGEVTYLARCVRHRRYSAPSARHSGSTSRTVVPRPTSLSISKLPDIAASSALAIARPMPMPLTCLV
jgi:hypothetical protein